MAAFRASIGHTAHRSRRIEHNLGAVDAVHHPVLRMMSAVANVNGYFAPLGIKYRVTERTLHIIRRLHFKFLEFLFFDC